MKNSLLFIFDEIPCTCTYTVHSCLSLYIISISFLLCLLQGFYRRAEASLGLADVGSSEGKDVSKLYEEALGDFCKCYYTMTMESDKGARVQQFCDAMIIAINLSKDQQKILIAMLVIQILVLLSFLYLFVLFIF